jgi:hypothetical protein
MKLTDKLPKDETLKAIIKQLRKLKKNQKMLNDLFKPETYNDK